MMTIAEARELLVHLTADEELSLSDEAQRLLRLVVRTREVLRGDLLGVIDALLDARLGLGSAEEVEESAVLALRRAALAAASFPSPEAEA